MSQENKLSPDSSSIKKELPVIDAADAVVKDSAEHDANYEVWLGKASKMCGTQMRGDINPVQKQAENIGPVADGLASQLGLEDLSEMMDTIDEVEARELEKMDEASRQFDFTAEDVGLNASSGSYTPALEQMWNNIESCKLNVERLSLHEEETEDMIMALESAKVIDQDTAIKLKERIPGSLDHLNIRMFTRLPSSVGYKLAREGTIAGKVVIGGLIIAGSIYLIYKILTWTIDGIKAIAKMIRRIRERRKNYKRNHDKAGEETFNPEATDLDKMAKALFDDPNDKVKSKMATCGMQPLNLRDIKWTETNDFKHLITPLLRSFIDDVDGSNVSIFNEHLEQLTEDIHESVCFTSDLLEGILAASGPELDANTIASFIQEQLKFVNKYIDAFSIPITFSNNSNVERLKAIYEWMDERNKPVFDIKLNKAPNSKVVNELCGISFSILDDEFASKVSGVRDILDPKGKKTLVVADTVEEANERKIIVKDLTVTFMALSNMLRSIYYHGVYVETLITAEDKFMAQVKKFTA